MGIGAEGFGFGVLSGKGAGGCRKIRQQTFPYPVFGRFTYTLSALDVHYLVWFWVVCGVLVMCVHIRQSVREQPDTGYRKCLLSYFAASTLGDGRGWRKSLAGW